MVALGLNLVCQRGLFDHLSHHLVVVMFVIARWFNHSHNRLIWRLKSLNYLDHFGAL